MVADRVGSLNKLILMSTMVVILSFTWFGIHSVAGIVVFACLCELALGAIVSLPLTIIARFSPNVAVRGTRIGMASISCAVGMLIGNPIAGALLDLERGVFWKAELFSAVMVTMGAGCFIWLRLVQWLKGDEWKM